MDGYSKSKTLQKMEHKDLDSLMDGLKRQ
jgi:hypothetical protein